MWVALYPAIVLSVSAALCKGFNLVPGLAAEVALVVCLGLNQRFQKLALQLGSARR